MIEHIELTNYLRFKEFSAKLGPFMTLTGPHGSGKTTVFDAILFVRDFVEDGLGHAVYHRVEDWHELAHRYIHDPISIRFRNDGVVYQLTLEPRKDWLVIAEEYCGRILGPKNKRHGLWRNELGEVFELIGGRIQHIETIDPNESSLRVSPRDETIAQDVLTTYQLFCAGITRLELNLWEMRQPAPPGEESKLAPTGWNLPLVLEKLQSENPRHYERWVQHMQTTFHGLQTVTVASEPYTGDCFLVATFEDGFSIPAWLFSDGMLRVMALTVLAYLPSIGLYLIEAVENGIAPSMLEPVYQSLSSTDLVRNGQILCTSYSPEFLILLRDHEKLDFSGEDGVS